MINIDWSRVAPVLISIAVILLIAVVRQYSRTFAAIAATMPLNIPLGMWIVYAGAGPDDKQAALAEFSQAAMLNIIPTFIFLVVAWQLSKAGYSVVTTILLGYVAWAVSLGLMFLIRALLS